MDLVQLKRLFLPLGKLLVLEMRLRTAGGHTKTHQALDNRAPDPCYSRKCVASQSLLG